MRLALDDFGTGYSSLSYLSRFPVDILKMDRSFLSDGASPRRPELANAVVALGATLSLEVVAEGIEDARAVEHAARARLRARPGILLSARPMDADASPCASCGARRRGTPPAMLHSHEALDRAGGASRGGLLAPLRHRDFRLLWVGHVRLAARRRGVPRRRGVAGLRDRRRADGDVARRDRDDGADDHVPARRRRGERPLRAPPADAGRRRRARGRRSRCWRRSRSPARSSCGT